MSAATDSPRERQEQELHAGIATNPQPTIQELEDDSTKHVGHPCPTDKLDADDQDVASLAAILAHIDTHDNGMQREAPSLSPALHEIALRCVFEFLVPPQGILYPSLSYGPYSGWLHMVRTLKSAALVSRTWSETALPFLYHDVVLRRVGQIAVFTRTLRSPTRPFASYVRSLTLSCYVPDCWLRLTRRLVAEITQCCPYLDALSIQGPFPTAHFIFATNADSDCEPQTVEAAVSVQMLQRLSQIALYDANQCGRIPGVDVAKLPGGTYSNLTSLSMLIRNSCDAPWEPSIHIPNLESLTLIVSQEDSSPSCHLPEGWDLPKLQTLRLRLERWTCDPGAVKNICRRYNATLRALDFARSFRVLLETQADAAALCMRLEHLVLQCTNIGELCNIVQRFDRLRYIALFRRNIQLVDLVVGRMSSRHLLYPALNLQGCAWSHIRLVREYLITQIPNTPYLFPWSSLGSQPRETRVFNFYGVTIREQGLWLGLHGGLEHASFQDWDVWSIDEEITTEKRPLSDFEGDEDTDEPDKDIDLDYTTDEGETDSEPDSDVTEEEALAIFESTLVDC